MDFADLDLKRKLGPLPVGAWIGIIAAGAAIAYFLNQRRNASGPAPAAATDTGVYDPLAGAGGFSPGAGGIEPVTPISSPDNTPQTNAAWVMKAANTMQVLRRPYSQTAVINALSRWLGGLSITTEQRQIVDDALRQTGYPPEGVLPEPEPTPTAPAPGTIGTAGYERTPPALVPKSKLGKRYTRVGQVGQRGERPDEIARRVYGSSIYANTLDWLNDSVRSPYTKPLPIGIQIAY